MKSSNVLIRLSGLSLCAVWLALAIGTHAQAQGVWEARAPMPTARIYTATGVIANKLYVATGQLTTALEVYDPATDTWTTKASIPTNRAGASAGVIDGKLYVVGGCINSDCRIGITNILEVYDPATDTWASKTPMPTPRSAMATGVIAGKLYVAGGTTYCGTCLGINTLEVYDPHTDTWSTKAPMPTARAGIDGAVINGKFHVVGGSTDNATALATLEVYDPSTDVWTTRAPMPTSRMALGTGAVNGILYAVSGYAPDTATLVHTVEAYDPTSNTWTTVAPIPTARYGPKPQGINGGLYVVGDGAGSSTHEAFIVTTNQPPVCSAARANPAALWEPKHQFVPIVILGVTDPENDPVTLTVLGVRQDEPVLTPGSDITSPDAVIVAGSASVRAERLGSGNGRVYQLAFKADDGQGGTCTGDVEVGVPHSMGKGVIAIDDGPVYNSTIP